MTAFRPSFDVVGVHFLKFKFFAADCALMSLLFVGSKSVTTVKGSDRKFLFFSRQQILVNARFLGNIFITHKALNFKLKLFGIKIGAFTVFIIE